MPIIAMPAAPIRVEPAPIKGSRFYGLLSPVQTEEDVKAHLHHVREELPGATHYCWAYCFEDGRSISNDDGEPTNSAGPPILRHIHGSGLVNVHIVVVRFFGGTKLGVGGLIRAYGDVAGQALREVEVISQPTRTRLTIHHDHDLTGIIDGVIHSYDIETITIEWGADVRRELAVVDESYAPFIDELNERTAGRVRPEQTD
ncbi:YigZ family protein [Stomatohabitans albus]|uniref:IMPACT family protein n=1 Tax=Stomatohabitans albus TaxID=3110766 RepID=UPI00300D5855